MPELTIAQKVAIWALPVLFAITLHEVAHGWVASKFGDQTARLSGRLTINPIKHIDLMGTIVVPLLMLFFSGFIFGWAKPVPVDARNLRNPRRDMAIVALAGPVSNLLMAIFWAATAKIGILLLDGNAWLGVPLVLMGEAGIMINLVLGVLNCIPIPPLDGGRVLSNLLPGRMAWQVSRIEPYSLLILVLLMVTGVLSYIIGPPIMLLSHWIAFIFGLPGG
ncbi:MAG: site-2 protease family protein [Gammaproteobacteria bacterium]|nr:site-2 protease family protein [Gammaproteobacteria bacterium]